MLLSSTYHNLAESLLLFWSARLWTRFEYNHLHTSIHPGSCIYIQAHTNILHRYCDSPSLRLHVVTYRTCFTPTHTHLPAHGHTRPSRWCEVTRPSCPQTGHQTGQWTLGHTIRHDSTDSPHTHTRTHAHTHTHTHTGTESWPLDLTWQQRLLLSLTPDPFLPVVPSSRAPPCPSLSRRTNVIEEPPFGQAVPHFCSTHIKHTCTLLSRTDTHSDNPCQAFRCRWKWTCGRRKQRGEGGSICVVHVSRAPPVPAHHVSDSTDLLAHQASVCVSVCVCVYVRLCEQDVQKTRAAGNYNQLFSLSTNSLVNP